MTKNNRFKKIVRAYQHSFDVPYMTALNAVSQPFVITPEMFALADRIRGLKPYGLVLITGKSGTGKTYLQHYLSNNLGSHRVIEQDKDEEIEKFVAPLLMASEKNLSKEDILTLSKDLKNPVVSVNLVAPFHGDALDKLETETKSVLVEYLRMRPDVLSLPEIRGNESFQYLKDLFMIPTHGTSVLTNIHGGNPADALDRLMRVFVNKKVISSPYAEEADEFVKYGVSLIVDVDRVRADGKSLITLSTYEVNDAVRQAWRQGTLDFYLKEQGFISASDKKEQLLKLI